MTATTAPTKAVYQEVPDLPPTPLEVAERRLAAVREYARGLRNSGAVNISPRLVAFDLDAILGDDL